MMGRAPGHYELLVSGSGPTALMTFIVVFEGQTLILTGESAPTGQLPTLDAAPTGPDDMAFWMYSSGSTGRPKGIVHLHHDMAYSQQSFGAEVLKLRPDDICFSVPKIFFAAQLKNGTPFHMSGSFQESNRPPCVKGSEVARSAPGGGDMGAESSGCT